MNSKQKHSLRGKKLGLKPKINPYKSWKKLHKLAWDEFSIFIRKREADWRENAHCITCGKYQHWRLMDAGHYLHAHLDFDEQNIHVQCKQCNGYKKGAPREYAAFLVRKYGRTILDDLKERSKNEKHYSTLDLQAIYQKYKKLNGQVS